MQAAANRSAAPSGVRSAARNEDYDVRALADDGALLDALPIAAGVFGLKQKKLWVHSLNRKFFDLAGCSGDAASFAEFFQRYAASEAGEFVRTYLCNPSKAPDEIDHEDGEGPQKRFLKLKLAPLVAGSEGHPRCLLSVVDRTIEIQAENNLRAEM
jgi:hypothetical protein